MYKAREFTAQIVDNFKDRWLEFAAKDGNITLQEAKGYYDGKDLDDLHDRISGKRVTIVEYSYFVTYATSNDYFEKIDNNFVLAEELFEEIKQ